MESEYDFEKTIKESLDMLNKITMDIRYGISIDDTLHAIEDLENYINLSIPKLPKEKCDEEER